MTTVWKAAEKREHCRKRQRNRCHWCGEQMNSRHLDPKSVTRGRTKNGKQRKTNGTATFPNVRNVNMEKSAAAFAATLTKSEEP